LRIQGRYECFDQSLKLGGWISGIVGHVTICFQVKRNLFTFRPDQKGAFVAESMANPQLVKSIGVMNGDIRNYQVCGQELFKHIGSDIALLNEFAGCAAGNFQSSKGRANQLLFNPVEIDALFDAEWTDDKRIHMLHLLTG
jgi:hypothetical protein